MSEIELRERVNPAFGEFAIAKAIGISPLRMAEINPKGDLAKCIDEIKKVRANSCTTLAHTKVSTVERRFVGMCFRYEVTRICGDEKGMSKVLLEAMEMLLCEWKWLNIYWVIDFLVDIYYEMKKECDESSVFDRSETSHLRKEVAMEVQKRYGIKCINVGAIIAFINAAFEQLRAEIKVTPPIGDLIRAIRQFVLKNTTPDVKIDTFIQTILRKNYKIIPELVSGSLGYEYTNIGRKLGMPENEIDVMKKHFTKLNVHQPSRTPSLTRK